MRVFAGLLLACACTSYAANYPYAGVELRQDIYPRITSVSTKIAESQKDDTYHMCDITMGYVEYCGVPTDIQNFPLKQKDGIYHMCDITMGNVEYCGIPADVKKFPAKQKDGLYHLCDITMGYIQYCGAPADIQNFPTNWDSK